MRDGIIIGLCLLSLALATWVLFSAFNRNSFGLARLAQIPIKPWDTADALLDRAFIRTHNRALARERPKLLSEESYARFRPVAGKVRRR